VRLEVLDDADGDGWDAARTGANARVATQDSTAIAYLGELDSGATRTSLPITNEAGLLQVSPGSGAEDLTSEALGSDQVPERTQPTGTRTFGRVVPSDAAQGEATAGWAASLGFEDVALFAAEDPFSEALIDGYESDPEGPPLIEGAAGAAAWFARADVLAVKGENIIPSAPAIFGSDALLDRDDLTSLRILTEACRTRTDCPGDPREIRITSAALDPSQLPAAGAEFVDAFEATAGRKPGRFAAYGYEAMAVVLDAIDRAEDPLDRSAVVDAFFATSERESILGTYSIDESGDTTLPALGAYRIEAGRPLAEPEPLELP
jgi:branched-chain amino acid transport system substrate-binding protein